MKKILLSLIMCGFLAGCQTPNSTIDKAINNNFPDNFTHNTEPKMCTMQYDPVCGKVENNGVFRYKTYGNACAARNSPDNVVSYSKGACGAEK